MKDFLEKEPEVLKLQKEIRALDKKRRALNKKLGIKIEKIISSKFGTAILKHKWRVSTKETYFSSEPSSPSGNFFGPKKSFSLGFEIAFDDIESKSMMTPNLSKYAIPLSANKIRVKKKVLTRGNPITGINSFEDLVSLCEKWDIYYVRWKNVKLSFSSACFRITSNSSMEDVYAAVKELKVPMDLKSHISQIESLEEELKRRKALVQDLSSNMLFGI